MIKSKKQMLIVIGVFTIVMLLGTTTFAFFNYTRTGSQNIIKTGRIYFNSEQGTAINLTNLFPVDPTKTGVMDDATKVGTVTINVIGDTTYSGGIEYLVSAVNVQNTTGNKKLPISIQVSVEDNNENDPSTSLGTFDADYFTNRGTSAQTSIYKVLASDVIKNNQDLVVGYIKSGQDGVDGNIVIKAYIDKNKVAISDTYPEETKREVVENYSTSACETALTGVANASTICVSANSIESALGSLTNEQLTALVNAGVLKEYTNGTPASFGEGRTVLTTTEWNGLQTNGVSFQVKVEANEGVWVDGPATPDEYFDTVLVLTGTYNTNRTSEDITSCVTYFTNEGWNEWLDEGETLEAFCGGTGTLRGSTIQHELDYGNFPSAITSYLESINIVSNVQKYVMISGYNPAGGSDVIIPKKINIKSYQYNTNRTREDIANCVTYFTNQRLNERLSEGETLESFCDGTGTLNGNTLQKWIDFDGFPSAFVSYLESINILTVSNQNKYPVKVIGDSAFNSNQLTSVTIPNSVTTIGPGAFSSNQLTSVTIPNSVTTIGNSAFAGNQLTSVTIPNSVTTIENSAFYGNPDLTSLTIDMNDIPENFASNSRITSLNELILGNNVTTIGEFAFKSNQLTSVIIPNSVTTIGPGAFNSNQLTSVTIPNSVTTIGNSVFYDNQLMSVIVPNNVIDSPWNEENRCYYFDDGVNVTWNGTTILCEKKTVEKE